MKTTESYQLFLYTAGTATALIVAVLFLFWKLLVPGLLLYAPLFKPVVGIAFFSIGTAAIAMYALLWICASTHLSRSRIISKSLAIYLHILFEPTCLLGYVFGLNRKAISHGYIRFLNRLVLLQNLSVPPNRLLILIPHCLQWDKCPHKITRNVQNCHRCGHCPVGTILEMAELHHTYLAVATGGTLARQIVKECRPKAIVAIACERDLVSGMQDVFPLPVLGLLNKRPHGPCFNTDVDTDALRLLLETITGEDYGQH